MYRFLKTICYVIGLLLKCYRNTVTYLYYVLIYRLFKLMKHLSALTKDFWNYMSLFATMNVLMYILKLRVLRTEEITTFRTESENSEKERQGQKWPLYGTTVNLPNIDLIKVVPELG